MMKKVTVLIDNSSHPSKRLDLVLLDLFKEQCQNLSRTQLHHMIDQGKVFFNDVVLKNHHGKIKEGKYTLIVEESKPCEMVATDLPLDVIYDDDDVIVINKEAGVTVHPGAGNYDQTLANALLYHFKNQLSGIGGIQRPGIVHRLDKETSGLMVIAKNDKAHHFLSQQFHDRTLSRTYVCFVWGIPQSLTGTIETLIGRHPRDRQKMTVLPQHTTSGKNAITHYQTLKIYRHQSKQEHAISMLECVLKTGRTHQIRVHCHHLGIPLIGDPLYGKKSPSPLWPEDIRTFSRQALHAKMLTFIHPTFQKPLTFECDLPDDMISLENSIKSISALAFEKK